MDITALPSFPAPFVGRTAELAHIDRLLAYPECRLLTLLGPGGTGKTRLALEAARRQQGHFTDGVYFAELQPLTAVEQVLPAVADAIGMQFYRGREMAQQLRDFLRERQILLVLDNFEHLQPAADTVGDWLAHAPGLKIIVTSRERLHLVEEWLLDIEGLAVPADDSAIEDYDAVRLFVQRAQRVQHDFELTPERKSAITRICRLVGGMPLGIELAAVWVRALSCDEIATEIEHSLDILSTPARNMPPRHRNMRAALEHSWNLLPPVEQKVFRRLSIFRGGFTREAAESVAGASVWTLTALRDKSLLRVDANGRYHLQELLRQYAEEQLEASGESQATHDAHSAFYADFLAARWETLISCHQPRAVREIDAEIDNIRMAWQTMCSGQKIAELYRSARSLWLGADLRCRFHEMVALFGQGAAALRPIASTPEAGVTFSILLALHGWFHVGAGMPDKGKLLIAEAIPLLQKYATPDDIFLGLYSRQLILMYYNEKDAAWDATKAAVDYARQHGLRWGLSRVLYHYANMTLDSVYHALSQVDPATLCDSVQAMIDECLVLLGDCGDLWVKAAVTGFLSGNLEWARGDIAAARRHYDESRVLYEEIGQSWAIGAIHRMLGHADWQLQNYESALKNYLTCLRVFHENGQVHEQLWALYSLVTHVIIKSEPLLAVTLLTTIARYSNEYSYTYNHPESILLRLEGEQPPEKYRAAVERGQHITLDTAVRALLADENTARWIPAEHRPSLPDPLTDRELENLKLMADGLTNRAIAEKLFLSVGTVKWYSSQILSKLNAENRIQALARAQEFQLLS